MWTGDSSLDRARASLEDVTHAVRRQSLLLALWVFACVAVATLLTHAGPPQFVATAQIVLQPLVVDDDGPELSRMVHQTDLDNNQAQTQLHLIQSDRLLQNVFQSLDLAATPDLSPAGDSLLTRFLRGLHRWQGTEKPSADSDRAFDRFGERVRARRLALSYVIEIAYRSQDPALAARVTNAIVSAYLRDRIGNAAADLKVGAAYLKSRFDAILVQELLATGSMKNGSVPSRDLADADIRFLGTAVPPLRPISPHPPLAMALAALLGLVSGLLAITIGARAHQAIRSRQHLQARLGLDCIGVLPASPDGPTGAGVMRPTLRSILAVLAAQGHMDRQSTIGVAAASAGGAAGTLAGPLVDLMLAARLPAALVAADPPAGQDLFTHKCAICHSPVQGTNKVGPSLYGVVGRKAGSPDGYAYSDAMRAALRLFGGIGLVGVVLTRPEARRFRLG